MQGLVKLNEKWWFGAAVVITAMAAIIAIAFTTGLSFQAAGVEVILDPNTPNGMELRFIAAP